MKPARKALAELAARDPGMGKIMKVLPPFPGFPSRPILPYFHTLARIVIYQQLASPAARTIHDRVKALGPQPRRFPTAREFLALEEEDLRDAGLSRNKIRAVTDLAQKVEGGEIKLRSLPYRDDDQVTELLTSVWGLGEWSAQMFLLFRLGRLDVFAPGDLGLREGVRILDDLDHRPTAARAAERAQVWAPLRSVASWYLWRLADGGGM